MEQKTTEQHFRNLGLEPGASMAEVKEAYRFLVQTFHEDKYRPTIHTAIGRVTRWSNSMTPMTS
jgi:preprotein translocase subunit Sec63